MLKVTVVGAGNAALCAAIAAAEQGAQVTVLEKAPYEARGGNSRFTAGAIRSVYSGVDDLRKIMPELTEEEIRNTDFGAYSREDFLDDLGRVTQYRCDPDLAERLVEDSFATLQWMHGHGVRFLPLYGRQSFRTEQGVRFWGGLTIEAWGGGPGLVDALTTAAQRLNVDIRYGAQADSLLQERGCTRGVRFICDGVVETQQADAVVLASGGFEANAAWRSRYLGPGWDLAKVRGTRFNTGDGLAMAIAAGAATRGHWSGCHAVGWDANAPEFGDLDVGDGFQKHSYPFGVMINRNGERFVDEGADFRNYTYARYGREILNQPGQLAWQIFDAKVHHLLRDEYHIREVSKVKADTLPELIERMALEDSDRAMQTLAEFNQAVAEETPFDPTIKDGRATHGLPLKKSNWANPLDTPPYEAYAVSCGITFTFGGLHVNSQAQVLDHGGKPISGLYAAGELVGGLFYFNYPGGSGLTSGAVFGRIAGQQAVL